MAACSPLQSRSGQLTWSDSSGSPLSSPPDSPIPSPRSSPYGLSSLRAISNAAAEDTVSGTRGRNRRAQLIPVKLPIRPKTPGGTGSKAAENILQIEERRNAFFVAKAHIVLPLLPERNFVRQLTEGKEYASQTIHPYEKLEAQPKVLQAELKPYQLKGLSFLLYLRKNGIGGILADEMGLGKTMQTLAFCQQVKENEGLLSAPFLVVCPLSILNTWNTEARKRAPGLSLLTFHGSPEQRANMKALIARGKRHKIANTPDLIITTYDTLAFDIAWFRRAFVWKSVILDEGHHIKNARTRKSKALKQLKTEFKLVLTGTPVQNDLEELWSIFNWLYPTIFDQSSCALFKDAFSLSEGKVDRAFLDHAKRFLELIMLRRVKDSPEVGVKLPQKTEVILSAPLATAQHQWYLQILTGCDQLPNGELDKNSSGEVQKIPIGSDGHPKPTVDQLAVGVPRKITYKVVHNMLMELRKCSIHPYLVEQAFPDPYVVGAHVVYNSGKFIVLATIIREFVIARQKKIIIFSGFDQALNLCEDVLTHIQSSGTEFGFVRIDGRTPSAQRNLGVHLFNNNPSCMVFLLSIRAGGEGLNLSSASVVVFLDEDWNPQVMRQAEARVHRIGQKEDVTIFKTHSRGTIEEQMVGRLAKKSYLAAKVTEDLKTFETLDELETMIEHDGVPENVSGSAAVIASFLAFLIRQRRRVGNPIDVGNLISWDWKTVLEVCSDNHLAQLEIPDAVPEDMEREWLRSKERIRTNVFNGVSVIKSPKNPRHEDRVETPRADRRIGKQRTVEIDGYQVTKENLRLSCGETSPISCKRPSRKKPIIHDHTCFLCEHADELLECQSCPRSFHQACLAAAAPLRHQHKTMLFCPSHHCAKCKKTASQAGNLLYCCKSCVRAYCEQCLDWTSTEFVGTEVYRDIGYFPKTSYYVECAECKDSLKRKHASDEFGSNKRVK